MKNILSYCLFGGKDRYWSPVPLVLIANSLVYPKYYMRFHVSSKIPEHPFYPIIKEVSNRTKYVEIKVVKKPYSKKQPTLWRMMPLWDRDIKYVFCRDLDAIPVKEEIKAVSAFIRKDFLIHGIRSYSLHTTELMAGLCGFDAFRLREGGFLPLSFWDYMESARKTNTECPNWAWGCDQEALKRFFYKNHKHKVFLMRNTLDTPLGSARHFLDGFRAKAIRNCEYEKSDLSGINKKILALSSRVHNFAGSPVLKRKMLRILPAALEINCEMSDMVKDIINNNKDLKEYYMRSEEE